MYVVTWEFEYHAFFPTSWINMRACNRKARACRRVAGGDHAPDARIEGFQRDVRQSVLQRRFHYHRASSSWHTNDAYLSDDLEKATQAETVVAYFGDLLCVLCVPLRLGG
jgi:hypothetical protein